MNDNEKKHLEVVNRVLPMQPDFEIKQIKLYNCDNIKFMRSVADDTYDLIITSPPYNLGNNHHTGNKRFVPYNDDLPESEYQQKQIELLNECFRILKPTGSLFYNHKNRIKNAVQITPYEWILKTKLTIKQEIVWFNRSQNFDKCRFYPMTERVYWLSKTKNTLFNNDINHHDLFKWQAEGTNKKHKRSFPVDMCKSILNCFPKGRVLDPYSGSATLGISCDDLGFEFDGCEIDKEYFDNAVERLKNNVQEYFDFA
jgi:DNA modification methylase